MEAFSTVTVLGIVIICSLTDIKSNRIPNIITIPGFVLAIGCHSISNGINGLIFGILGAATGIGLLMLPYVLGGMGAGDVKLMGTVGSFLGAKATFEAFLLIALAGGVYSLALILIRRDVFRGFFSEKMMVLSCMVMLREYVPIQAQSENSGQKLRLKYGVAIAFGTITYMLLKSLGIKFLM